MMYPMHPDKKNGKEENKRGNRIMDVLLKRLGSSQTFGENIIFMLNRGGKSW